MALDKSDDAAGRIIGDYTILSRISEGTFAVVYKACSNIDGSVVALKCLYPNSHPRRIEKEIRALTKLGDHKYVSSLLDGSSNGEDITLVLEYFEHADFKSYYYKMTPKFLKSYMRALLESLDYVHKAGIIHRDIKPANFLHRLGTEEYLLVDFGLAQRIEEFAPANIKRKRLLKKQKCERGSQQSSHSNSVRSQNASRKRVYGNTSSNQQMSASKRRKTLLRSATQPTGCSPASSGFMTTPPAPSPKLSPTTASADPANANSTSKHRRGPKGLPDSRSNSNSTESSEHEKLLSEKRKSEQRKSEKLKSQRLKSAKLKSQKLKSSKFPQNGRVKYKEDSSECSVKRNIGSYTLRPLPRVERCGTRGFRAPEVLLKIEEQSTALDLWSAGVIMLCIMSRRYPFFRSPDDTFAMCELIRLFGYKKFRKYVSESAERRLNVHFSKKPAKTVRLETIISKLFTGVDENLYCNPNEDPPWSPEAYKLLEQLMELDHKKRISAENALKHPFFCS